MILTTCARKVRSVHDEATSASREHEGARFFFIYSSLGVGIHHLLGGFGDVDHLFCFPLLFRLRLEDVDHLLRIGRFQRTWIIYSGYHNYPLLSDISQGQPGGSTKGSALVQFYAAHGIVGEHRGA